MSSGHRVVYHNNGAKADAAAYFSGLMVSLENHLAAAPDAEIVVVSQAGGVGMFRMAADDANLRGTIAALRGRGVRFLVCANTLAANGLAWSDLPDVAAGDVVPSGVAALADFQLRGFAYIHL